MTKLLQKRLPPEFAASLNLNELVEDYYSSSLEELDMSIEALKMREYQREAARSFEYIHVPDVYSSEKGVLIMEYIDGWLLKDFPVNYLSFKERVLIMTDLAHGYIESMLVGIFHADAHGSNIIIDRHRKRAVVIDWGMTGKIDGIMAQVLMRTIMHVQLNQAEDAAEVFMELFIPTIYTDPVKMKDELRTLALDYVNVNQGSERYNYGRLVIDAMTVGMRNFCKVPSGLALWAKGFSATEGVARWLCPEISYGQMIETYEMGILKSMVSKRFDHRANGSLLAESSKLSGTFPRRANKILENLADNKLRTNMKVQPDKVTRNTINQVVNRVVLALITFAVIIATAFIAGSIPKATFLGMKTETLANVILIVSVVLVFFLLWRMFRTRRHRSLF